MAVIFVKLKSRATPQTQIQARKKARKVGGISPARVDAGREKFVAVAIKSAHVHRTDSQVSRVRSPRVFFHHPPQWRSVLKQRLIFNKIRVETIEPGLTLSGD